MLLLLIVKHSISALFLKIPALIKLFPISKTKFKYKSFEVKIHKIFYMIFCCSDKTIYICSTLFAGTLAQLVEQRTENPCVRSSILRGTT